MSKYKLYENGEFICEAEFYKEEVEALRKADFTVVKVGADNE